MLYEVITVSLQKPALETLHDTLCEGDVLLRLLRGSAGKGVASGYRDFLFDAWRKRFGESGRRAFLEQGYFEESLPAKRVSLDGKKAASLLGGAQTGGKPGDPVLVLAPSLRTFDGRSRGLPLLSEIPDPLTTISYGRWLSVSPETAAEAGLIV